MRPPLQSGAALSVGGGPGAAALHDAVGIAGAATSGGRAVADTLRRRSSPRGADLRGRDGVREEGHADDILLEGGQSPAPGVAVEEPPRDPADLRIGEFAGLAFVEMDWTDRALLFLELMGVPPPLPERPPALDYAAAVQRIAISD